MDYDLLCPPRTLQAGAAFASYSDGAPDVTLTAASGRLTIGQGGRVLISADVAEDASGQMTLTPEALRAAANWAQAGNDMADVALLVDDTMLLVSQGDDRAGFDTGGEPASDEYLSVAPLDRPDATREDSTP